MSKEEKYITFSIRIPADLKKEIIKRAEENTRTANQEIIHMLKTSIRSLKKNGASE